MGKRYKPPVEVKKGNFTCLYCGGKKSKKKYRSCQKCMFKLPEYKRNMSKSLKGKNGWSKGLTKENNETIKNMARNKIGRKLSEEHKKKIGLAHKGRKHSREHIINQSKSQKGKRRPEKTAKKLSKIGKENSENLRNRLKKRIEKGEMSKNPHCKFYYFKGIACQGKSELKWVKQNHEKLIRKKKKAFTTPYGLIIPDFETKENIIEVKSPHTFKNMKLRQFMGYLWINKNFKPVVIYVDKGRYWQKNKINELKKPKNKVVVKNG